MRNNVHCTKNYQIRKCKTFTVSLKYQVSDPYRWLEDPDSAETIQFVEAHNKITQPYLEGCDQWKNINEKLTKLWNYPKFTNPARHGDYYYYYMNTGLQNQK